MATKKEEVFDLKTALCEIVDADWKRKAFYTYTKSRGIVIKNKNELDKKYKEFYGGKIV